MGWLKNLGHSINNTFNNALPYALAGTQIAGTALLGPQAGQAIASGQGMVAGALGHPTLSGQNTGLNSVLSSIFGGGGQGGINVQTPDFSIQTGGAANNATQGANVASFTSGIMGNPIKLLLVAGVVWILYRMTKKSKRK